MDISRNLSLPYPGGNIQQLEYAILSDGGYQGYQHTDESFPEAGCDISGTKRAIFWISGLLWISHHLMHGCVGHTAWGPEGEKDEVKQAQSKLEVKALRALRLLVAS